MSERRSSEFSLGAADTVLVRTGPVLAIGGAENRDATCHESILGEFVRLSGGMRARLVVIPTASADPGTRGEAYRQVFQILGAETVEILLVEQRSDANQEAVVALLQRSSGVFITGGDQARLVALLVGTAVMQAIQRCNQQGTVVAGTSAGAAVLSAHMLVPSGVSGLETSDSSPRKGETMLVTGFGLLPDIIIDQHFSQRGRIGRLLEAFAANPGLLGLGIDEDTAALIESSNRLTVLGRGAVTILDGRDAQSDFFERLPGEVVSVVDSHLFVLGAGRHFDLGVRRPIKFRDTP